MAVDLIVARPSRRMVLVRQGAKKLQRPAPDDALVIVEKPATQIKFPAEPPAQGPLF